jgi:predicted hydrocarbon binding protein
MNKANKNVKKLIVDFLSTEENGWADTKPIIDFIKNQLEENRPKGVVELFSEIYRIKNKVLNKLVSEIVYSKTWTYFVQDLSLKNIRKKLSKEEVKPPIRLGVSYPRQIFKNQTAGMRVYVYRPKSSSKQRHLGGESHSDIVVGEKNTITILPRLQGCTFTPEMINLEWTSNRRWANFDVKVTSNNPNFRFCRPRPGVVRFFMNSIAIGEVNIRVFLENDSRVAESVKSTAYMIANPFGNIFASFADEDTTIGNNVKSVANTLGNNYVNYISKKNKGWNEKINQKIEEADIFQLFWSHNAKESEIVAEEWKHALNCKNNSSIRPIYWEKPLKNYSPPKELKSLKFTFLTLT